MAKTVLKEGLLSLIASAVTGGVGAGVLHMPLEQSGVIAGSTFVTAMALLMIHRNMVRPSELDIIEEDETEVITPEQYEALEAKYQEALAKAEKFEKENKTTELFLASMSHELRTPLNGIVGLTELLDGTELTEEQKEFTSMIRESSENLRVIVNDILDISKINAGKMELEYIPFNLFQKIEASAGVFTSKIEEKGIMLNLFTDPQIPREVVGDPTRLSQVIINLVSNAVKFTEKGGKIDVFAEYISKKDNKVIFKVSVKDSGIGLTPEQQKKIFEAYSQAEASTTRKAGGTGLGLTISSRIIQSMGGKLQVKSQKGKGAMFYFTLALEIAPSTEKEIKKDPSFHVSALLSEFNPNSQWKYILKKYVEYYGATYDTYDEISQVPADTQMLLVDQTALDAFGLDRFTRSPGKRVLLTSSLLQNQLDDARKVFDEIVYMPVTFEKVGRLLDNQSKEEDRLKPAKKSAAAEKRKPKGFDELHILVAEDNPINQKLIKVVLENFGLNVTIVGNGIEAINARKSGNYDMIFMDIQMPEMGGVEATHEILAYEKEKGIPHIPIIALTANALTGDKEKYMAEGMDDYATKPLDIKVIEKLISAYCNVEK